MAPFFFTWPGFETREVENQLKGDVEGKWRVLEVTFPEELHTHCRVQKFYVDDSYVVRRMDYSAEVTGSLPTAHMLFDHRKVDGLLFPMLRRAVRNPDGLTAGGPSAVLLDFYDAVVVDEDSVSPNKL